jgi:hypothetical protein
MKQWACAKCDERELCDDCWFIKQAEEKQKRDVEERMSSRSFGANGASEAASERDERGHNLGKASGAKKGGAPIAFNNGNGESELPARANAPTALGKFRSLKRSLDSLVNKYEQGLREVPEQAESLGPTLTALLDEAFELGRDSKEITPTLRYCRDLGCSEPVAKRKQFCKRHKDERRAWQNRQAQQRLRSKQKSANKQKGGKQE